MSDFIKNASVLLISSKPAHRAGIRKLLVDMGADNQKIEVASDFNQSVEKLSKKTIHLVISDEDIQPGGDILDLISSYHSHNPSHHSRLIVLMCAGLTDDLKNEFFKRGGDLIIPKPYTSATFTAPLNDIIEKKCNLSEDEKISFEIEAALTKNNKQSAVEFIKRLKNPNSASANYSLGMISKFDQDYAKAYQHFLKSIEKKVDLKILTNLVDVGVKSKKYTELSKYVEKWIKKFPLKNESVPDITRVVIYNKNFGLLNEMKTLDQEAKIPIAAGLVVASSVYLDRGEREKSIEYALKGIEFSGLRPMIVLKALEVLIQAGAKEKAKELITQSELKASLNRDTELIKAIGQLFGEPLSF